MIFAAEESAIAGLGRPCANAAGAHTIKKKAARDSLDI